MRTHDDDCRASRMLDEIAEALRQWGDDLTPLQVRALRRAVGLEGPSLCERCLSEDAIPDAEHGLCAYCVAYNNGRAAL